MTEPNSKVALVTGTAGLGLAIADGLLRDGVEVIVAGRTVAGGEAALSELRKSRPAAKVSFELIDLADIPGIAAAAKKIASERERIDILVNSAGLVSMGRSETASGAEMIFGVNHLGHFALTGHLLPVLRNSPGPRVVSIVGAAYRTAKIEFDDINGQNGFNPMKAAAQSMLAKALFAQELQRRSDAHGWGIVSLAADPGFARTNLMSSATGPMRLLAGVLGTLFGQSAADGARPALMAATGDVVPGGHYAPGGATGLRGVPVRKQVAPSGADAEVAARLWELSQAMTGSPFPV